MINDHLAKGGLVMDAYRNEGQFPVSEAFLDEDWDGREDSVLCLRCPNMATVTMPCILDTDRLEVHGHEVHYFSGTDYCGKVVFLNPAPVDLTARADADADADAARDAANAAYAAAVARCNRAVDARDAAADVARDAASDAADAAADADRAAANADAAADAAADADAAYVAAEVEAKAAYAAMVAARNATV